MGFSLKLSVHFMLFCSHLQCKYDQFYITNTLVYFVGMLGTYTRTACSFKNVAAAHRITLNVVSTPHVPCCSVTYNLKI